MYEAFFKLQHKPFSLLPDPDFLFLSSRHAIGLSLLEYSLTGQAGFCVITGEIGSGKTTLVRAFLGRVGKDFTVGLISNTHHALKDIAAWAIGAFGQKATSTHPSETYQELMSYLIAEYGAGRQCILIVDEAQNLSIEVLEELRLLSNINSGKDLLLQVVLVGQPELLDKLKRPELSQFAQRIAVSHHLTPLPYAETRRYIQHRVKVAGADRPLFTEMAMGAIQYFSGGIPRLINSICDMALVYGFADEQHTIGEDLVFRVVSDRQLSGIAPFAQSVPVDDPAVLAEIIKLATQGQNPVESAGRSELRHGTGAGVSPAATIPHRETNDILAKVPDLPPRAVEASVLAQPPRIVEPDKSPALRAEPVRAEPVRAEPAALVAPARDLATASIHEITPPAASNTTALIPLRAEPVADSSRRNPYFFRDQEDDEELLLTVEMNDSSLNAHRRMPSANPTALSRMDGEPYLGATRESENSAAHAGSSPNQELVAEESTDPVVDPGPWPSISDRRTSAPIPAKEHGTATPPKRSWWRRSIGRNS
jgi:type II secretory pathway predicted ATPase ExeA